MKCHAHLWSFLFDLRTFNFEMIMKYINTTLNTLNKNGPTATAEPCMCVHARKT